MRRLVCAVWMTAAVMFGPRVCGAQQSAPRPAMELSVEEVSLGGTGVSLEQLLEHAAQYSPRIAIAVAEVGLADADLAVATPLLQENATLQVGLGSRTVGNGGSVLGGQVQFLQPIEIGGQRRRRRAVAGASRTTRDVRVDQVRWQVHQEIHSGYRFALVARRRAQIARRFAAFALQLVDIAERRIQAGDEAPLIARLAQAEAAQAAQTAVALVQEYREACLRLAEAAGWPVTSLPEPIGVLPSPRDAPALSELLALATTSNPELLVRSAMLEEAELRADLAAREALPDPQFGFQYGYEGDPSGGPAEHIIMGMLQLSLTSFDRNQGDRMRTNAERAVASSRRDAVSSLMEVRLERLRTAVNAAAQRVRSYRSEILPGFEGNLVMLRRSFAVGEIDLLQVSFALGRFLTIQGQALDAHIQYFAAVAALEARIGVEIWGREGDAE